MLSNLSTQRWSTLSVCGCALLVAGLAFGLTRMLSGSADNSQPNLANHTTGPRTGTADKSSSGQEQDFQSAWQRPNKAPACPARDRDLEAMLERLARTDPKGALALAMAEPNWLRRDQLRNAALRGWGAVAPDAAADWAMGQTDLANRYFGVEAVLAGAVEQPDEAVRVALRLCAADPTPAGNYGHALINALIEKTGSYEAATRFAISAKMVDRQSYLLDSAFYQWSQQQPDQALAEFSKISDPAVREFAMKGVIAGWADADPKKLADYAQSMPPGEDRTKFMSMALMQWGRTKPEETMQWINQFEPHPDFDKGFATLALGETILKTRPEMAIEMTEYITDPAQRTLTRDRAFWDWALRDPAGARKYAESVQNPEYRASMLDDLTRLPKD